MASAATKSAPAGKLRKKRRPAARRPVDVRVVADDDQDDEAEQLAGAPLFEVVDGRRVDSILVERTDPDEGTLGKCPPHFTEMDIKRRWGGGTFKLQARDEKNKPMKGGFRTITIAGDPLFESATAAAKWKRQQGIEPTMSAGAPGFGDVLSLLKANEAAGRAEAEKRLTEAQQRHAMDLERLEREAKIRQQEKKEEDERRERERRDRDEREKREREERDERLRKEAEDRDDRRRREDEAARMREREFMAMMAQLNKQGRGDTNPTEMLIKGIEIAQKVAGGDLDPLSELARNIPGILETGKELIRPGGATKKDDDKTLTLEGPLGLKALALVEHFKRNGIDPARGFENMFDHMLSLGKQAEPAAAASPAAGAGAPPAAPPAAPARAPDPPPATSAGPKVVPMNGRRRRRAA